VREMQAAVASQVVFPAAYAVSWSGQFEYLERATERLKLVVPATLAVIFVLLYVLFRSFRDATLVMAAVPFSLIGGFWLVWALGHAISVATAVGFIALAGVAAEFGVVMQVYLNHALKRRLAAGEPDTEATLLAAIREGAVLRVRPKAMTVAVVMAGLLPILLGSGTGSEVMTRIAAPMVGGMVTAPLLSMLIIPAAWYLLHRRPGRQAGARAALVTAPAGRADGRFAPSHYIDEDEQATNDGVDHHRERADHRSCAGAREARRSSRHPPGVARHVPRRRSRAPEDQVHPRHGRHGEARQGLRNRA
jgi:copper/silver efflux system protein